MGSGGVTRSGGPYGASHSNGSSVGCQPPLRWVFRRTICPDPTGEHPRSGSSTGPRRPPTSPSPYVPLPLRPLAPSQTSRLGPWGHPFPVLSVPVLYHLLLPPVPSDSRRGPERFLSLGLRVSSRNPFALGRDPPPYTGSIVTPEKFLSSYLFLFPSSPPVLDHLWILRGKSVSLKRCACGGRSGVGTVLPRPMTGIECPF